MASNEGKLRKQADRGQQAERLLKNKILNECFDKIERTIYEAWSSRGSNSETRENAYMLHRALDSLKCEIEHISRTGKGARQELTQLNEQQDKKG